MWKLFVPDAYIKELFAFDYKKLKAKGKRIIVCDIDNTLVGHDESVANERTTSFLNYVKSLGFEVILVSNNWKSRVSVFAESVDLPYESFAKKPLPFVYYKICRRMKCKMDEIAVIGDQMMTDVVGSHLAKAYVILTEPAVKKDLMSTKISRRIEKAVCKILKKKQLFEKGEYYES